VPVRASSRRRTTRTACACDDLAGSGCVWVRSRDHVRRHQGNLLTGPGVRGTIAGVRTGRVIGALAVLAAVAPAAHADRILDHLDDMAMDYGDNPGKIQRSYSQQIADRLTWLGEEMDEHFGKLSFDRVAIRVDGRARRAKIRLGKGDGGMLSMRIDSDIKFANGLARVNARIDLSINGHRVSLDLPKVELVPSSYQGERYLEVRIPLIEGSFEPETWFR
jgi:hypothetical protein